MIIFYLGISKKSWNNILTDVQEESRRSQKILEGSKRSQKVLEGSKGSQKILEGSRGSQKVPEDLWRF